MEEFLRNGLFTIFEVIGRGLWIIAKSIWDIMGCVKDNFLTTLFIGICGCIIYMSIRYILRKSNIIN